MEIQQGHKLSALPAASWCPFHSGDHGTVEFWKEPFASQERWRALLDIVAWLVDREECRGSSS